MTPNTPRTTGSVSGLDAILADLPRDAAFTDTLTIPAATGAVSAVIATYNRCPFDPAEGRLADNPLVWALESLLAQAGEALGEVVVVDDGSSDHTPAVLAHYRAHTGAVPIRSLRLERHVGCAVARNAALAAAAGRWVLLGDDDCVWSPHAAAGGAYLLHTLTQRDAATAGVMLPFYYRALRPRVLVDTDRVGLLAPEAAEFGTHFHAWPDAYLPHPPHLDRDSGLVAPLRVGLIGGTALLDQEWLRKIGGFVDLAAWSTSYSDHLHLSADLTDAGARLYHCPDPRLAAAHLKFGAAGRFPLDAADLEQVAPGAGRPLRELVALSAQPRVDTGNRVSDEEFHAEMLGSFFAFFAGRSLAGGLAWATRTWQEFVQAGEWYSLTVTHRPDSEARLQAWRAGLTRGARFLLHGARPGRTHAEVGDLLAAITKATGQPPLTGWSA